MPAYYQHKYKIHPKDHQIDETEMKKLYDNCKDNQERLIICLLWLTAARPFELLLLRKENIIYPATVLDKYTLVEKKDDRIVQFKIQTLKMEKEQNEGRFFVKFRTLEFERKTGLSLNIYLETIMLNIQNLKETDFVLPYRSRRWIEKKVNDLTQRVIGMQLSPYCFRHSKYTLLASLGYPPEYIKQMKGAKSLKSVDEYVHAIPLRVRLDQRKTLNEVVEGMSDEELNRLGDLIRERSIKNPPSV